MKAEKRTLERKNLEIMKIKIIGVFPSLFSSVATYMQGKNKVFFSSQMGKYDTSFKGVKDSTQTSHSEDKGYYYEIASVQMLRCSALAPQAGIITWLQDKIFLPRITEYGRNWQNST